MSWSGMLPRITAKRRRAFRVRILQEVGLAKLDRQIAKEWIVAVFLKRLRDRTTDNCCPRAVQLKLNRATIALADDTLAVTQRLKVGEGVRAGGAGADKDFRSRLCGLRRIPMTVAAQILAASNPDNLCVSAVWALDGLRQRVAAELHGPNGADRGLNGRRKVRKTIDNLMDGGAVQ